MCVEAALPGKSLSTITTHETLSTVTAHVWFLHLVLAKVTLMTIVWFLINGILHLKRVFKLGGECGKISNFVRCIMSHKYLFSTTKATQSQCLAVVQLIWRLLFDDELEL